jgi:hypothetical protein
MKNFSKQKTIKMETKEIANNIEDPHIIQIKNFKVDPEFDIQTHLKHCLKISDSKCEIHESDFTGYCFVCKRSICEVCSESYHSQHHTLRKNEIKINSDFIKSLFKETELKIKSTEETIQFNKLINELKSKTEMEFNNIDKKLQELKSKKIKEIEKLSSGNYMESLKILKENVSSSKKSLINHVTKNKDYYNFAENNDTDNFLFLSFFDLINDAYNSNLEYNSVLNKLCSDFLTFDFSSEPTFNNIIIEIENSLERLKRSEVKSMNSILIDCEDGKINKNEEIKQKLSQNFSKLNDDYFKLMKEKLVKMEKHFNQFTNYVYDSFRKSGNLLEIDKITKVFEDKTAQKINYSSSSHMKLSYSSKSKVKISQTKLGNKENKNKNNIDIKQNKLGLITENDIDADEQKEINEFNKSNQKEDLALNSLDFTNKNEEEIHVNIKENIKINEKYKTNKKIHDMFKPKEKYFTNKEDNFMKVSLHTKKNKHELNNSLKLETANENTNENICLTETSTNNRNSANRNNRNNTSINNNPSINKKQQNSTFNEKAVKLKDLMKDIEIQSNKIKSKEDCTLKIPIIRKFYSFNTLEFLGKKNIDLNHKVKKNTFEFLDSKDDKNYKAEDYVKVIEGTNEIAIFNKSSKRIERMRVDIDKKIFGRTTFPIGCRFLLNEENLYITGGKDMIGVKSLFWMYSIKEMKLIKLANSKFPHAYHTIFFHENLRCIILLGGENSSNCEMYDLYLNIWTPLPSMNVSRANCRYYIDKMGVFIYAIFGQEKNILDKLYSDTIEVLNIVDMNMGWAKIDYNKKGLVDLKHTELQVHGLSNEKLLFYGAVTNRDTSHCFIVFDLNSFELYEIDEFDLEKIRVEKALPIETTIKSMKLYKP